MILQCFVVLLLMLPSERDSRYNYIKLDRLFTTAFLALIPVSSTYQWSKLFYSKLQVLDDTLQEVSPRVLNFFPIPVEEECLSEDKRRRGICMNTYECRIQQGKSHGPCALGFGVCCIFTTSCGGEVRNNLTYVISPDFPNLIDQPMNCSVRIGKVEREISQLRIDFLHFNIGQPNRRTGICDEDVLEINNGNKNLRICGWNSGQHVYMDINENVQTTLNFQLPRGMQSRMWEMLLVQLPFEQRAPAGCLQYFQRPRGTLKTLNYLPNGRYLANQDHLLCVRQEKGMCSISYTPCAKDAFRIGSMRVSSNTSSTTSGSTSASTTSSSASAPNDEFEGSGSSSPEEDEGELSTSSSSASSRRCEDRVLIPCDFEEFITPGNNGAGICDLEHCGNSLCDAVDSQRNNNTCRVETSATPFHIRVAFGPGQDNGSSADDNLGMCLTFEQQPCVP